MSFFLFLLNNRKLVLVALTAVSILGGAGYLYFKGKADCRNAEQVKALQITVRETAEATISRERIEDETRRLSDTDVDRELIANGWMRTSDR